MSTKYNIITKTTYKDFCEKTSDIQIIKSDLEIRTITLIDKFGNICHLDYDDDERITALRRIGKNDPAYMLYLLVTLTNAIFLSEDDFKNCIQVALMNMPDTKVVEISNDAYEEFTKYFRDYVKYSRDFEKEYQLYNEKKQTGSGLSLINQTLWMIKMAIV